MGGMSRGVSIWEAHWQSEEVLVPLVVGMYLQLWVEFRFQFGGVSSWEGFISLSGEGSSSQAVLLVTFFGRAIDE